MKKTYTLENLGCANCAAKMEAKISKLDGVESAKVNFLLQTLVLCAAEERLAEIEKEAAEIIRKIEPKCKLKG